MALAKRYLGGESGHRTLLGTGAKRARTVGLVCVFLVSLVLMPTMGVWGLLIALVLGIGVWAGTASTHRRTPLDRIRDRRLWKARDAAGLAVFHPVSTRPLALERVMEHGSRRERNAARREWNAYRDWPDGVEGMQWLLAERGMPGIAWHTPTGEDAWLSVVFPLAGQLSGLQPDSVVNGRSRSFGELLAARGSRLARANRIQMITRVQPVDTAHHESWLVDELDQEAPRELLESYQQLVDQLGAGGLTQRHYAVARWPITREFVAAARRRGPNQSGWIQLMATEIDGMGRELAAAGLAPGRALSAAQTAAVLRHMQFPSWPIDQAGDVNPHEPWMASEEAWAYNRVFATSPTGEPEEWFHRTAEVPIMSVETGERDALWMAPMLSRMPAKVIRTISVQLEGMAQEAARLKVRGDYVSDLADMEAKSRGGKLVDAETSVSAQAAAARMHDLRPGSGHQGLGWAMHVTVSGRSVDELREACELMEDAGEASGVSLRWLDAHQAAAHACTWPLARGMKPMDESAGQKLTGRLAGTGEKEALT